MGKATGNISQKAVAVKLNKQQIEVLDRLVENGEFEGRSHAIRELLLPALQAGIVAMNTGSGLKGIFRYGREIKKLNDRYDKMAKNGKEFREASRQQQIDLEGVPKITVKLDEGAVA